MEKCIKCRFSVYTTEAGVTKHEVCISQKRWYKNGEWKTEYHEWSLTKGECHKDPPDPKYGFAQIYEDAIGCGEWRVNKLNEGGKL